MLGDKRFTIANCGNSGRRSVHISDTFKTRKATMMEGLVWGSLLTLLIKRRVGFSVQQLAGVELSTFMLAKNTQGWFYQLMESITQGVISTLKKNMAKDDKFFVKIC
jgi:hypothetical protein